MLKHHQHAAALAVLGGMFLVPATPKAEANSFLPLPARTRPSRTTVAKSRR